MKFITWKWPCYNSSFSYSIVAAKLLTLESQVLFYSYNQAFFFECVGNSNIYRHGDLSSFISCKFFFFIH
jgi:hypothetical protein